VIVKTYIVRKAIYFIFTFSHFEDAFIESDLHTWINAVPFNFVFIKESKKKVANVPIKIKQHNTRNKSAYYNDFWRSCDTEDWSIPYDAENSVLVNRNKLYFEVY